MSQYYYSNGRERFGPFTLDQLRTKNIAFQTLVWKEGMTDWVQAGKMIELQPLFYPPQISAPPPPPAAFPAQRYQYLNYRDLRHLQEINEGYLTFHPGKIVTLETGTQIITYELASFWSRVAARLLDLLIILLPSFLFPLIVGWLYWSIQESSASQATIGKKALGIKVLSVNGSKVSFGQATGRFFGNILNVLTLFIGIFMFFFSDRNQCLHDSISGCIVVKEIDRKVVITPELPQVNPIDNDNKFRV